MYEYKSRTPIEVEYHLDELSCTLRLTIYSVVSPPHMQALWARHGYVYS